MFTAFFFQMVVWVAVVMAVCFAIGWGVWLLNGVCVVPVKWWSARRRQRHQQ